MNLDPTLFAVLNMGGETIKLLEDTIHFINGLGLGKDFLSRTQKALPLEKKIDKLGYIKIRNSVLQKRSLRQNKGKTPDWKNIH